MQNRPPQAKAETRQLSFRLMMALPFSILAQAAMAAMASAETIKSHGISTFGDLSLEADFEHLPYVNPDAQKGGEMSFALSSGYSMYAHSKQ